MIGKLKQIFPLRGGEWMVSFTTTTDFSKAFEELLPHDVDIEIKRHRQKRSLDANAYFWVLVGEIAAKMDLPKNEVYRKAIMENGVYRVVPIPDEDVEGWCMDWCSFGLGFQVETFKSVEEGLTNVIFYKGSSFYDTKEMARLIDGIIHEAEGLGIPTITPAEEAKMLEKWGKK